MSKAKTCEDRGRAQHLSAGQMKDRLQQPAQEQTTKTMDLKRKLGIGSGQSYELIRSTQSLVERLNLNTGDISIQPVHPSIMGQDNWFSITYSSSKTTRYFSCQNERERDEWIVSLRKTLTPMEDRRRTDNSLKICVFEVKGLSDKKNYFCEIHLDDKIYARTSSKKMTGMCFWGEYFTFSELPKVEKITILIFKDKGKQRKQRKPVGRVKICVSSVLSRREVEKWYTVEKTSRRDSPSIRIKCQYQSIDILPLPEYQDFLKYLRDDYKLVCKMLEPQISVKVKEELSASLMNIFNIEEVAEDVLADLVVDEISSNENETLTFRGNSIATKSMEAYMKLVGEKYLEDTLRSTLNDILHSDLDLEVDPVKVSNADILFSHRQDLRNVVTIVWKRISNSHSLFPVRLQRCLHKIRQYLVQMGKEDMADKLTSSCLFLRYLCPAVLGPNLFNLTDEYPNERSNRNLTLIAKTLMTLANFARYEGKENSMEFMNIFLDEESENMRKFLQIVSGPPPEDWIDNLSGSSDRVDLGKHSSLLHTILVENISKIPAASNVNFDELKTILNDINGSLHRPTTKILDSIAEPTPVKLGRLSVEQNLQKPVTPTNYQSTGISNWIGLGSWTLGRGDKRSKPHVSRPIPQHELRSNGQSTFYTPESTESSSSSTSLTPSPKYNEDPRMWAYNSQTVGGIRKPSRISASSISIIDDSDSESSSASSHYRGSDISGHQHGLRYSTLPRPRTAETKTLSDYEREIHGLRSAMETLQVKLHDAERRLQMQQCVGSSSGSDRSTNSPRQSPAKDDFISRINMQHQQHQQPEDQVKAIVSRLLKEEDMLRRDRVEIGEEAGDKEMMILLQQRKIKALDEANNRLQVELSKLGDDCNTGPRPGYRTKSKSVQDTPKTVDELLDSFNDTPV